MIMFFTTVGFTVSIPALLKGGKAVLLCLLVAVVMIPVQNFLGGGVMALFGKDPLLGIGCGSIALVGGPGTAAAWTVLSWRPPAQWAEAWSPSPPPPSAWWPAPSWAAPPPAGSSTNTGSAPTAPRCAPARPAQRSWPPMWPARTTFSSSSPRFVKGFMVLLLAVGIGSQVSAWLTALTRLTFPGYIGAMLVAVVVRNVMDGMKVEYPAEEIDTMGNMFLSIFLAMALAGLKLWELVDLALPMLLCLVAQCVVMVLFSYLIVFRVMGRNYDAAVMTAGFIGFSMGATSNAMANMQVVTKKYGPSPVAYFAIPMVGGMFIDFFNAVLITFNIGLWAH